MDIEAVVALANSLEASDYLRKTPIPEVERKVQELLASSSFPLSAIQQSEGQIWFRGRRCESTAGYANLYDCIYPKPERVGCNRANYPGEPVFYASWNRGTVLSELGIETGQFVQFIASRPRPGAPIHCFTVGDFEYFHNSGRSLIAPQLEESYIQGLKTSPLDGVFKRLFVDAFLAKQFRVRTKHPYEHKLTAAFAKLMFKTGAGIMYPSVETPGGMNLAIPAKLFADHFEVLWTDVVKAHYLGCSLHAPRDSVRYSEEFGDNGDINWKSNRKLLQTLSFDFKAGYSPLEPWPGWRVPKLFRD
jgi:hypothetical protein